MGGVLTEVRDNVLAVWPRALRSALLRQVFFEGPAKLSYRPFLKRAPVFESAVSAIVTARHYGAEVPESELRDLIERCKSPRLRQSYAALGEEQARWVLAQYSGDVIDVAREVIECAPRAAIPRLLDRAAKAPVPPSSSLRPLDVVESWMRDLTAEDSRPGEAIRRRRLAVLSAKRYVQERGDRRTAIQLVLLALSPTLESTDRDPGDGRTITLRSRLLSVEQLQKFASIWDEGRHLIEEIDTETWTDLKRALWDWLYPRHASQGESQETMRAFAGKVLGDLVPLAEGSPGLIAGLKRLARRISLDLPLENDPIFELLYPDELAERSKRDAAETESLGDLASRWQAEWSSGDVAQTLCRYEAEAQRVGQLWPARRRTSASCWPRW